MGTTHPSTAVYIPPHKKQPYNPLHTNDMNELEKMKQGMLYDFSAPEPQQSHIECMIKNEAFNRTPMYDTEAHRRTLEALIPGIPPTTDIAPPFYCDHGHMITIGSDTFINYGATILDGGGITIGNHCKIGPNCQIYTINHPLDYMQRRQPVETGYHVTIGDDCWLGGGVILCPGVTIGNRCIIAAGSVVTRDIPDDTLAAGNPATVKRKLR